MNQTLLTLVRDMVTAVGKLTNLSLDFTFSVQSRFYIYKQFSTKQPVNNSRGWSFPHSTNLKIDIFIFLSIFSIAIKNFIHPRIMHICKYLINKF